MTQERFAQIVTQYEKLVYTICYQFSHDHHTAQDLAQETFLSAYRNIASCPPEYYKPWLCRIATNKAKDFLKSAYHRRVTLPPEDAPPENSRNLLFMAAEQPEDITIQSETLQMIQDEIYALQEPYHQVSVLFFLEEKTVNEIADLLDRPPKTVHTQLYRAKRILQQKLKEEIPHEVF